MFKHFIFSDNKIIIVINLLNLSVDAFNINAVLHVRVLKSFENYAQKSGKAGYNGKISQIVIFLNNKVNMLVDKNKAHRAVLLNYIQKNRYQNLL